MSVLLGWLLSDFETLCGLALERGILGSNPGLVPQCGHLGFPQCTYGQTPAMGLEFKAHMSSWHEFACQKKIIKISLLALGSFQIYNISL